MQNEEELHQLKQQVKEMSEKLNFFENSFMQNQKDIIKQALTEFTNQKKDSLKSEFDRKFRQNKKQIIKQKIIETVKTKPLPLADLKYLIVNQLEYCSKASFYRYIEDMKDVLQTKENIVYLIQQVAI